MQGKCSCTQTKCWPKAVTANLGPYAVRQTNDIMNELPRLNVKDPNLRGKSPLETFSQVPVMVDPFRWHPFGCPAYVLDNAQQATGKGNKWTERACIGVYIGRSPQHARSVSLILNLQTGLVLLQYHVKLDPSFQTVRKQLGAFPTKSLWQKKCGFEGSDDISKPTAPKVNPPPPGTAMERRGNPTDGQAVHTIHHSWSDCQ